MTDQPTEWKQAVCVGKDAFTAQQANKVARRYQKKGIRLTAYRCKHCGQHHVGKDPK